MFAKEKEKPVAATEEKKEPKTHGSGRSTGTYYKVEVRAWHLPKVIPMADRRDPFIIDDKWREWPLVFNRAGIGPAPSVPVRACTEHAAEHGLLTHDAAMAHQWALYAALDANGWGGSLCIETRLVAVEFSESYSITEVGVSAILPRPRRAWDDFKDRATMDAIPPQRD